MGAHRAGLLSRRVGSTSTRTRSSWWGLSSFVCRGAQRPDPRACNPRQDRCGGQLHEQCHGDGLPQLETRRSGHHVEPRVQHEEGHAHQRAHRGTPVAATQCDARDEQPRDLKGVEPDPGEPPAVQAGRWRRPALDQRRSRERDAEPAGPRCKERRSADEGGADPPTGGDRPGPPSERWQARSARRARASACGRSARRRSRRHLVPPGSDAARSSRRAIAERAVKATVTGTPVPTAGQGCAPAVERVVRSPDLSVRVVP